MFISCSGIEIPKSLPAAASIIENLTRIVYDWKRTASSIKFFEEYENHYLIPRFYPVDKHNVISDISNVGKDIEINSKITPRNNRQKKSIEFFLNNRNGILQLEPGSGKTVVCIASICEIKKKTIIFVHKDKLATQWNDEFLKHTDLKQEDIGFLDSSSIKRLSNSINNKKIIIATIQSMLWVLKCDNKKKLIDDADIGVSIFDEAHVAVGPDKFSKVALNINTYRIYGLSATPRKELGDIVSYYLGEIFKFEAESNELLIPRINVIKCNLGVVTRYKKYINWQNNFNISKYYKQLKKSEKYMGLINNLILKSYNNNRNMLVLGTRIDNLLLFAEKTKLPKNDIGIFIPGTTEEQRLKYSDTCDLMEAFRTKRIVFGTYSSARDGISRDDLDCLLMTCSTSNIEQAIGRILRSMENKPKAIVFDVLDMDPEVPMYNSLESDDKVTLFYRQYEKRKRLYLEKKWDVREMDVK